MEPAKTYSAFVGTRRLGGGEAPVVVRHAKGLLAEEPGARILFFDDDTGNAAHFDLQGTLDEVVARVEPAPLRSGPGRPKLGVVCREISLLPRHWEWLERQPQGSSAALRRLVDEARKREPAKERVRRAVEAIGKVMWALASHLEGFEEASRALYAGDAATFATLVHAWPDDLGAHFLRCLQDAQRGRTTG